MHCFAYTHTPVRSVAFTRTLPQCEWVFFVFVVVVAAIVSSRSGKDSLACGRPPRHHPRRHRDHFFIEGTRCVA